MNKTYTLPIYKKIGGSYALNALPHDSNIHVASDQKLEVQYNPLLGTLYPATIHNIKKTKTTLVLTTNTLAIQLTNVYKDNIPLYYRIDISDFVVNLNLIEINEKLSIALGSEYLYASGIVYHNSDSVYINVFNTNIVNLPVMDLSTSLQDSNLVFKYLKDRIRVTIKTNLADTYAIRLKYDHVFGVDCLGTTSLRLQPFYYDRVFNNLRHSYKVTTVTELKAIYEDETTLKRFPITQPVSQTINPTTKTYTYTTLIDNLTLPSSEDIFIYYRKNPSPLLNIQRQVILSPTELSDSDLIYIGKTILTIKNVVMTLNRYKDTSVYPVDMSKVVASSNVRRYSNYKQIALGKNNFVYSLQEYTYRRDRYLSVDNVMIYQQLQNEDWSDLPVVQGTTLINSLLQVQQTHPVLSTYLYEGVS